MKRIKHFRKWLIHAIAECSDCDFHDENYMTAQETARKHNLKTGHEVHIESGYTSIYERRLVCDDEGEA